MVLMADLHCAIELAVSASVHAALQTDQPRLPIIATQVSMNVKLNYYTVTWLVCMES